MKMNKLLWMHCFVRAVETGSFSAVARELGIGQPNVSRHIASLEQDLGVQLLHRSTRQLTVTPEGQRYYAQARVALDAIARAEADARGQQNPHGLLRVACAPGLGIEKIVGALPEFMSRYPDVEVELRFGDGYVDLVAEGVDVALRGGVLKDSALRARRVGMSQRICVASPAYLERHGTPQHPDDLLRHECIVYTLLAGGGWPFRESQVQVHGRLRMNSLEGIRRAALEGMGIAYLPSWMVMEHLGGPGSRLQPVLSAHAAPPTPLNAVYSAERLPHRASVFIDFVAEVLAATPGLAMRQMVTIN